MLRTWTALLLLSFGFTQTISPKRPVSTYSIVARDPDTGQLGVAVQSHWFSVGPLVAWAEPGVGAVATQSFIDPNYGPLGLELMKAGRTSQETMDALVSTDSGKDVRQVGMIDANGNTAVFTGNNTIPYAGHKMGENYSVQANLMEKPTVWDAMAHAFESSDGDLAEKLLVALEAAQREGGDIRGKQSAAILVVSGDATGFPWIDRIFDLRIADHPTPVKELRRLVQLKRAYLKLNEGDEWVTKHQMEKAVSAYEIATSLVEDKQTNGEAPFWVGVTLIEAHQIEESYPYFRRAYRQDKSWAELINRLPAAGLLPDDKILLKKIIIEMQK
ncbi:MAG: DUF1028 domain-containing protein [Candidatus Marinimicrobia bacterium]|nr:DUF1028 domain-containing protein [Candidatus Neomarinimicrobiota bacterium]MBT6937959.1 DUF1028 domain-containing protein [Candidatus Neomarinimicrobiota bacterium]